MARAVWKGSVQTAPVPPVLVTCGDMEKPNVFTVAWTGTLCTQPPKTYISVRPERYSYNIIKESGEFVINLTTENIVRAVDYCGVKSGRNENKLEKTGLTPLPASVVSAPILEQSPLALECKVCDIVPLGSHDMFIADIVAVSADESYIDGSGRLALEKAGLVAYAHGQYFALGKCLGTFGFSVRKRKKSAYKK